MFNNNDKNKETSDYIEILNKMLEIEKEKKKTNPIKITICIVGRDWKCYVYCYIMLFYSEK